jgi:hypothetical protein
MVSINRPTRPVAIRFVFAFALVAAISSSVSADPDPLKVEFLPLATSACAIAAPDSNLLVSVYLSSSALTKATWVSGNIRKDLEFIGEDKVTRLCFFNNPRPGTDTATQWANDFRDENPGNLRAVAPSRTTTCTFDKWVTQVGDKVLPLGLLSVSFQDGIPPAGTPLIDSKGKIIALILQPASGNTAYAIPAQAIRRVQRDIVKHRKLVRGWIGITLSTSSLIPRITGVLPGSPAAAAGIMENDILIRAGEYPTARYPDAVNALFYSVPGETAAFQILRDTRRMDYKVTPIAK